MQSLEITFCNKKNVDTTLQQNQTHLKIVAALQQHFFCAILLYCT